jgi:hypothetical protein
MGIWKKISIKAFDAAWVRYVKWMPIYNQQDDIWEVNIEAIFDLASQSEVNGDLSLKLTSEDESSVLVDQSQNVQIIPIPGT